MGTTMKGRQEEPPPYKAQRQRRYTNCLKRHSNKRLRLLGRYRNTGRVAVPGRWTKKGLSERKHKGARRREALKVR